MCILPFCELAQDLHAWKSCICFVTAMSGFSEAPWRPSDQHPDQVWSSWDCACMLVPGAPGLGQWLCPHWSVFVDKFSSFHFFMRSGSVKRSVQGCYEEQKQCIQEPGTGWVTDELWHFHDPLSYPFLPSLSSISYLNHSRIHPVGPLSDSCPIPSLLQCSQRDVA